jgi:hypothetical protein
MGIHSASRTEEEDFSYEAKVKTDGRKGIEGRDSVK